MKLRDIRSSLQMDRQVSLKVYECIRRTNILTIEKYISYRIIHRINMNVLWLWNSVYPKIKDQVNEVKRG